jgi:hypothetical protein
MPEVLFAYAIAALLVAIVFVIAFVLGRAFGGARPFLNLIGIVIVAIALLEKAGWSVRPWSLGSPAAAFNDLLFRPGRRWILVCLLGRRAPMITS